MLYLEVVVIFITVFIFFYMVLSSLFKNKILIKNRIEQIKEPYMVTEDNENNKTFIERILIPFYKTFSEFFLKTTPSHKLASLSKKLERAGLLKNTTTEKWLFNKFMVMLIIAILLGLLTYVIEPNLLKSAFISILVMLFINVYFNFYISKKIETRKRNILRELPYTVDLITVSVEAGLSFDGAMARVVSNISGDLCDEFSKSLKEIRMGIQRKVALRNMSERCGVRELSMLITSLIQADDLGVSLGRVLRIEASNLREHRKQVAREKAMKAPIKMLFPLIFFIFPSIFIIILGPAVIRIMNIFITG
ncbi:MAG: type II secretion system F family protein [Clostridiaceae bacterium]